MKPLRTIRHLAAICIFALFTPFLVAGSADAPVATMAHILVGVNHYPSDEEKAKLAEIAGDADNSEAVQTIAKALHDMQHKVSAGDKEKLQAIVASAEADDEVKTLAEVLMNVNHKASDDAVAKLKALQ